MESEYYNNIVNIRNKESNEYVELDRCIIRKVSSMYSNTKEPIYKLVIDNVPISRNNTYTVKYKCYTCDIQQEITLNLFIRKVNKGIRRCEACRNKAEDKCKKQSVFMKHNASVIIAGDYIQSKERVKDKPLDVKLNISQSEWEKEEEKFKEQYFIRHLTTEDFERIRNKIISVNNDKLTDITNWEYFPIYRIYNQSRYVPILIDKDHTICEKPLYIKYNCENCDGIFKHRDLHVLKNHHKILCQTCSLTNKIFRIRKIQLKNGECVLWQSIPERRFIEWCEENNISIKNGPNLIYIFKDTHHTYRVDFELPEHNILVEIKDNHHWHHQQIISGKFKQKEDAALEWCTKNNYTYHLIFPKTLQRFKDSILSRKSL
jgi:hypothetical protein